MKHPEQPYCDVWRFPAKLIGIGRWYSFSRGFHYFTGVHLLAQCRVQFPYCILEYCNRLIAIYNSYETDRKYQITLDSNIAIRQTGSSASL